MRSSLTPSPIGVTSPGLPCAKRSILAAIFALVRLSANPLSHREKVSVWRSSGTLHYVAYTLHNGKRHLRLFRTLCGEGSIRKFRRART